MDSMQPTVMFDPSASLPGPNSLDVSRAHVGFVAGNGPHFSDETAALLRSRLASAALVLTVVLAAAFAGNIARGMSTHW